MENNKNIQLYVNVDGNGNILDVQMGETIIPTDAFHYFFKIDEEMAANVGKYKVVIHSMKPALELKEGARANEQH